VTDSRQTSRVRRWVVALTTLALIAMTILIPAASVSAAAEPTNMVLVWNENAVNVIGQPATNTPPGLGQGPPIAALHVAMVQGAIYDAVNAIDGGHAPYLAGLSAPSTASKAAAVAQAGHDVLYGITPPANTAVRSRIDGMLTASLALIDPSQAKVDGIEIGADAAAAMLAARANDGRTDVEPFIPSNDVGKWRLGPPLNANVQGQFATVVPLTMKSPDQFRTEGMPALTSAQYAAEFNEVKALGAQSGSSRTPAQTLMAGFYTANPLFFYNAGLRVIATDEGLSTSEQARLFVKTSMAGADALIGCWNNKKFWNAWRPATAIHEALTDGNPLTSPDEHWTSLFAVPGYPDEPSGYNCYTGGFWQSARFFFGTDKFAFSLTSPGVPANAAAGNPVGVPGSTRTYKRFTDVIDDTINGRILNGFHFRTADVHGAWIGKKAAQWIDKHYFGPVD
jgi:vanadium-dependent haloperoxidase-like protein